MEAFALVPQHVHLEGMIIRKGPQREIVASGARVLIRSLPVGDPPAETDGPSSDPPSSWFDPVPEGRQVQRSTELFIDRSDLTELVRGLQRFTRTSERSSHHAPREMEAVYAWDSRLVFRTVKRNRWPVNFLTCATDPPVNVPVPIGRTGELNRWLDRVSTALKEVEEE